MDSKETKTKIGKNIEYILETEHIPRGEFSEKIGITSSHLLHIIKGERGISVTKLLEISRITGYSIDFLITGRKVSLEEELNEKMKKSMELVNELEAVISSVIRP